jgi:lysyl-tRNA synthetase class 2
MKIRRPKQETLVALAAAAVGAISVVSALTPGIAARSEFVRTVLPPGVPSAARFVALALGLVLLWLSRSLVRRKRRAWLLAVVLVTTTAVAHLAKGLDAEEATLSLLLLGALFHYRARFDVRGDPASLRPLVATSLTLASLGGFLALYELHRVTAPEDLEDLVSVTAALLALRALYLWLRPWTERVRDDASARRAVRAIVERHGRDSLAFFALRRDKSYFFSPTRRSFLAYRVVAGSALVSGDPVGEETELASLLEEFRRVARARGWRLAILGASEKLVPLYRSLGLRTMKLGDEAVVRPAAFSLEGRGIRKVRQSVHRLHRAGYRARVVHMSEIDSALRARLHEVSTEWLGRWPERGFVMAMDDLFAEGTVVAVAETGEGEIGGFLHLVPCPAAGGFSLSTMRRRSASPNGLMEFLIAETIAWAQACDMPRLSLNFCVFADLLRTQELSSASTRALRFTLLRLDRVFQLQRLLSFSGKFFPQWEARYICLERLIDFPLVGLAYLQLESLLTPPRPWTSTKRRERAAAAAAADPGPPSGSGG